MDSLRQNHKEFIKTNKLTLKSQQRFRSEKHNVFPEEVNQIALSAKNDKRIQSINSIETYACRPRKDLVYRKKKLHVKI